MEHFHQTFGDWVYGTLCCTKKEATRGSVDYKVKAERGVQKMKPYTIRVLVVATQWNSAVPAQKEGMRRAEELTDICDGKNPDRAWTYLVPIGNRLRERCRPAHLSTYLAEVFGAFEHQSRHLISSHWKFYGDGNQLKSIKYMLIHSETEALTHIRHIIPAPAATQFTFFMTYKRMGER